jgi:hypothetical protein
MVKENLCRKLDLPNLKIQNCFFSAFVTRETCIYSIRTYGLSNTASGTKESLLSSLFIRPVKFYFITFSKEEARGEGEERSSPPPNMPFFQSTENEDRRKSHRSPRDYFQERLSVSSVVYSCKSF